jgi:polyhydroxybutyrate depolymerase
MRQVLSTLVVSSLALAVPAAEPARRVWSVDGVSREALVYAPAATNGAAAPVVFVFHGHGGNMRHMARAFPLHALWPEALVVYMQGLPTPGRLTDPEGKKSGWQTVPGGQGDRDLRFVDVVMDDLRSGAAIDGKQVFAAGHSNGGAFVYLLWALRPQVFCAFAPCAAATSQNARLTPKPVLHVAGQKDALVKFAWQQRMIDEVRSINRCGGEGQPWGTNATLYASAARAPVVALIHPGGHELPPEAAPAVARFFRERGGQPAGVPEPGLRRVMP